MIYPDIVIVKPGNQRKTYGELSDYGLTAIEPPLWGALLAGYLRKLGYNVELFDAEVEQWSFVETAEKINEVNPMMALISVSGTNPSASTMNMTSAGEILHHLKKIAPEIKTVLHGLHPSALPERTLKEEAVDFVCQGEGFYTLPELINALKGRETYFRIDGLWCIKNGTIIKNSRSLLFNNLDELPMPAWDLLPMTKYRAHNWHCFEKIESRQPYGVIYTSLGCPYNCTFCCINAIFGRSGIRYRSPQNVIQEIDFLVTTYGLKNIKIIDELFGLNENRVVEICDLIIARGYDLNMWAYARVNTVTPKMLSKMKQAGINWVAYGFESGSERVLKAVKKAYDLDSVQKVVRMTYDQGLNIVSNFIFGLPEDNFNSMHKTLALAQEINAEWCNLYTTMAYPGSKIYEEALKNNCQLPDSWHGFSQYSYESFPLSTKYLSSGEVLSFRDYAFHSYFDSPGYLDKIKNRFGIQTVQHIQDMTKRRLKRKLTQF
jgi:radical SAM superfamily enzyme YgiQ (UPF0313 family)